MTGAALKLRYELAQLAKQYGAAAEPFTPIALAPPIDGNLITAGYAASATVDRERMQFAARCWMPFKREIRLLFRHDRPAGNVEEVRCDDRGLYARVFVTDAEAKRCPYFSIAATT